jgi:tetratricopeptide (TPR) repeat protein
MRTGPQNFSATTVISYVLTLVLWAYHPSSFGDQTDIRLPNLFDELTDASNRLDAKIIEQKIWVIWHTGPDPEVDEWFNQAQAAASSGDSLRALQIFKSVTSKYPRYAEGWNQRAIMHYLMGDIEDSLKTIAKTLELEPRHFGALAGSGQCYLHLELFEQALNAFEAALSINPWIEYARQHVEMLRALLKQQPKSI